MLVRYPSCFVASEFVDYLAQHKGKKRTQGVIAGQMLLDAKYITHVRDEEKLFRDEYMLFNITPAAFQTDANVSQVDTDQYLPRWFRKIEQEHLARNRSGTAPALSETPPQASAMQTPPMSPSAALGDALATPGPIGRTRSVSKPIPVERAGTTPFASTTSFRSRAVHAASHDMHSPSPAAALVSDDEAREHGLQRHSVSPTGLVSIPSAPLSGLDLDESTKSLRQSIREMTHEANANVLKRMTIQALAKAEIDELWLEPILSLVEKASGNLRPDVRNGDRMDVREYIKVRCLPGGMRDNILYCSGVIFNKNVSHKAMRTTIRNPRILMLRFPLEFASRGDSKYASLDSLERQEKVG
jgi:1-phosphatidylinositol-3-phosphate 5-kinase